MQIVEPLVNHSELVRQAGNGVFGLLSGDTDMMFPARKDTGADLVQALEIGAKFSFLPCRFHLAGSLDGHLDLYRLVPAQHQPSHHANHGQQ